MHPDVLKVNIAGHFHDVDTVRTRRPQPMDHLLIWVVRGTFRLRVADDAYLGAAGDLFTLEPGSAQDYGSGPPAGWEWLWVHFQGSAAAPFVDAIRAHGDGPRGRHVRLGLDDRIRDRFLELVVASPGRTLRGPDQRGSILADSCLYSLLGLMIDRLQRRARIGPDEPAVDIAALQRFVHEHLAEPLSVERLAAQAGLSRAHYARQVKRLLGVSPMRYVIRKRVERAATLLEQTPMKLAAIAAAVGYDDPYYFSRLFKKVTGVPPSTYRRRSTATR